MNKLTTLTLSVATLLFWQVPLSLAQVTAPLDDSRPTIAVPLVKSVNEKHTKYLAPITQKVTEILRSSKRFVVVSRTDEDVKAERQFQKSEEFLDRKMNGDNTSDLVDQSKKYQNIRMEVLENGEAVFYGAQYILVAEIRKLDIVKLLNADNSTKGYKALIGLQLSVNTTATNTLSEAKGFQSMPIENAMFSPERAVDEAIVTLEGQLSRYFLSSFPLICTISKTMGQEVMINAGSAQGVTDGARFKVTVLENLQGEPVELEIGELRVKNIASEKFAQCQITKGKAVILEKFARNAVIKCTLLNK